MRKLLFASAAVLTLAAGLAGAQTVNKALQLSQDATGAYTVDSFYGVKFPGHIFSNYTGFRPSPTVAGTGTPTISGTDTAGTVTMGTSATTAVVTFGTAYGSIPVCVAQGSTQYTTTSLSLVPATTSLALTQNSTSGNKIGYICMSAS